MPVPAPQLPGELAAVADGLDEATCLELVAEAALGLASALGLSREAATALIGRLARNDP